MANPLNKGEGIGLIKERNLGGRPKGSQNKVGVRINLRVVEHTSYHNDIRKDLNTMVMYSSGQPPLTQAVLNRDYPMVQGCILLIAFTYVTVNLVTDVMYGVLDPRIRLE